MSYMPDMGFFPVDISCSGVACLLSADTLDFPSFNATSSLDGLMVAGADTTKDASMSLTTVAFRAALAMFATTWAWSRYSRRVPKRVNKWGSGSVARRASQSLVKVAETIGLTYSSEIKDRPDHVRDLEGKQVMACWHPHGCYVMTPLLFLSSGPRDRESSTYGFFTMVAGACFSAPVFREILMLVNARVAEKKVIDGLLENGKSVFICPGGIHEQLMTDPDMERVFFAPNLGFIRQAMAHGVPLVPTYNFGENQLFDVPDWGRKLSFRLKKALGMGVPIGLGRWGLPFLPKKVHITTRVGLPVEVGPANLNPSEEQVQEVFRRYCIELHRVFNKHKATDLPSEVAQKGLQVVWRGHEHLDLSWDALSASPPIGEQVSGRRVQVEASSSDASEATSPLLPMVRTFTDKMNVL